MLTAITPLDISPELHDLFHRHKARFKGGVPDSIYDFVSRDTVGPTDCHMLTVRDKNVVVAASFFDVGGESLSSIYCIFDPEMRSQSLGIYTMLKEIEFAREHVKPFYYHGYAYEGESFYDYKKTLRGVRDLRLERELDAGNAGALACNAGSSGVTMRRYIRPTLSPSSSASRSGTLAGEGACVPVYRPFIYATS